MARESKRLVQRRRRKQVQALVLAAGAVAVVAIVAAATLLAPPPNGGNPLPPGTICPEKVASNRCAVILTASGTIVFEIQADIAPRTAAHFTALFQSGAYSGEDWHRVEPDFVIQAGNDVTSGTIDLERTPQMQNVRGAVAVARTSDPNSGSSQFYILRRDSLHLDQGDGYAVFGMVRVGMDVVDRVVQGEVISGISVVDHYPL